MTDKTRNEIQLFTNEELDVKVRCIQNEDGSISMNLEDTAIGYGWTKKANSGNVVVRWSRVNEFLAEFGVTTSGHGDFIPESVFYLLGMKASNETAKKFQMWLATDVIPSIRKHGAYMTEQTLEQALTSPDFLIRLATELKNEKTARKLAEQKIEEQKPLVDFANKVSVSSNLIDMGKMAKLLKDEHINIGRNRLFEWLRDNKILMSNNMPYQKYIDGGYFTVKESIYNTPYGTKTQQVTFVTGKGQIYITEKLRGYSK